MISSDLDVQHGGNQASGEKSATSLPSSMQTVIEIVSVLGGTRSLAGSVSSRVELKGTIGTADNFDRVSGKELGHLREAAPRKIAAASAVTLLAAQWFKTC